MRYYNNLLVVFDSDCLLDTIGFLQTKVPGVKSVISKASGSKADLLIEAGDKIHFGSLFLEVRMQVFISLIYSLMKLNLRQIILDLWGFSFNLKGMDREECEPHRTLLLKLIKLLYELWLLFLLFTFAS